MSKQNIQSFHKRKLWLLIFLMSDCLLSEARAQSAAGAVEDSSSSYILLFVLIFGLAGAIYWRFSSKKVEAAEKNPFSKPKATVKTETHRETALNGDRENEAARKNRNLVDQKTSRKPRAKKVSSSSAPSDASAKTNGAKSESEKSASGEADKNAATLPVFSIRRLEMARPFEPLPYSDDESLINAIEQTQDEFEEDEEIRELTVRILAAFRTRNSVESLSQIALYDLTASLRSKAVSVLSEFDHESVFETILLGCADPTREVRAAAARGLTKLTFDRADAWTRIGESSEGGRVVQSARAAVESGFVEMSFDRLVHPDRRYVYESVALMALLIKSGETEKIFNALENHRDMNVRRAILHIIRITKDQKALEGLYSLLEKNNLPIDFQEEIDKTIEKIGFVTT